MTMREINDPTDL